MSNSLTTMAEHRRAKEAARRDSTAEVKVLIGALLLVAIGVAIGLLLR